MVSEDESEEDEVSDTVNFPEEKPTLVTSEKYINGTKWLKHSILGLQREAF